jgi:hypothetical protein
VLGINFPNENLAEFDFEIKFNKKIQSFAFYRYYLFSLSYCRLSVCFTSFLPVHFSLSWPSTVQLTACCYFQTDFLKYFFIFLTGSLYPVCRGYLCFDIQCDCFSSAITGRTIGTCSGYNRQMLFNKSVQIKQCCGPVFGIRCLFDPWVRDR